VLAFAGAVGLFLVLPPGFGWQTLGGFVYGLLIQYSMPGAAGMFWVNHGGASRRERVLTNGALILAAWLGAWLFWPLVDFWYGLGRVPGVPFIAASFAGAAVYFHGVVRMLPEDG
jgi:hypothetical protein